MKKYIIEDNSSERITIITYPDNLSIKTEFKGGLPSSLPQYKLSVLNREEVRRLLPLAERWLKGVKQ